MLKITSSHIVAQHLPNLPNLPKSESDRLNAILDPFGAGAEYDKLCEFCKTKPPNIAEWYLKDYKAWVCEECYKKYHDPII